MNMHGATKTHQRGSLGNLLASGKEESINVLVTSSIDKMYIYFQFQVLPPSMLLLSPLHQPQSLSVGISCQTFQRMVSS